MFRDPGSEGISTVRSIDRITGLPDFRLSQQEKTFLDAGPLPIRTKRLIKGTKVPTVDIYGIPNVNPATLVFDPLKGIATEEDLRLVGRRKQLLTSLVEDYGFENEDIRIVSNLWEQATQNVESRLAAAPTTLTPGTHTSFGTISSAPVRTRATAQEIQEEFSSLLGAQSEAALGRLELERLGTGVADPGDRRMASLASKVDDLMEGLPMSRDGQYILTASGLKDIKTGFTGMLEELQGIARGRTLTFEESDTVKKLQQQINAIDVALSKQNEGDVIARVNLGMGQIKGEAFIMSDRMAQRFRDPITGLLPRVITDITNLKGEVGSDIVRNLLLDVGEEKPEVFSDPLMFLYHEEYFSQSTFRRTLQANAASGLANVSGFTETADIPREVLRQLEMDLADEVSTVVPSTRHAVPVQRLDPVFRSANLRMKKEAEEIVLALRAGEDPRNIPALMRRVADHYMSKVVRYKGRPDVAMPTAQRFALRTFESVADMGYGFQGSVRHGIDLSHYGMAGSVSDEINFLQFRIKGHDMLLAGRAARLYKNSLGGFDLDDKGIPLMSTFVDTSKKKRLAFFTLRQPTSFQESIAMVADLTDVSTIRALFKDNQRLINAVHDDAFIGGLGYTTRSGAVQKLREILPSTGRGGPRNGRISASLARQVENLAIQLIESDRVNGTELPGLTSSQIAQMLMTQDPSVLGLSSTVRSGSKLFELMREVGLNPSKEPSPYSSDTVFQIFRRKGESRVQGQIIAAVESELGITFSGDAAAKMQEITNLIDKTGPRYAQGMEHRVATAVRTILEDVQRAAAETTVEESIGLFINRQAASIYNLQHSRRIMEQSGTATAEDIGILRRASTIFTLPASEAVDFSKQISLEQFLTTQGEALSRINTEMGIDPESVLETMVAYFQHMSTKEGTPMPSEDQIRRALLNLPDGAPMPALSLDAVGKQMLKSFKSVGVIRAQQIAQQVATTGAVDVDSLFGLQRSLFEGDFARISEYGTDQTAAVDQVLSGLTEYLRTKSGLTTQQTAAIQNHIDELTAARSSGTDAEGATKRVLESLYMREGTDAYRRFADMDQIARELQQIYTAAEVEKSKVIAGARERSTAPIATVKSRFRTESRNIVSNIRQEIDIIKTKSSSIRAAGRDVAVSEVYSLRQARIAAATKVFEGVSAARAAAQAAGETFGGRETLDVVESVLANLIRQLPETEAEALLRTEILSESEDLTVMQELFGAARRRMLGKAQAARTDMAMALDPRIQGAYDFASDSRSLLSQHVRSELGGALPRNLEDVTSDQAAGIIKGIRKYRKAAGTGIDPAENEALRILSELMGQRKRDRAVFQADEMARITPEAENAYRYYYGGRRMVDQQENIAGDIASTRLLGSGGGPIAPGSAEAIRTSVDDVVRAAPVRTAYKRFGESLRSGALGEAVRNPLVRRGAIAAVALAAFGFIHSARKDHAESDIMGPPLLPGGSAYEKDYPRTMVEPSTDKYQGTAAPGAQYRIYTTGSQDDSERLSSMLQGVVDGPINSTMYNSLPQLGRDPYSSVASSF